MLGGGFMKFTGQTFILKYIAKNFVFNMSYLFPTLEIREKHIYRYYFWKKLKKRNPEAMRSVAYAWKIYSAVGIQMIA